jgi:hypothetical protein
MRHLLSHSPTLSFALALNRYGDTMYKQACARGPTVLSLLLHSGRRQGVHSLSDLLFQGEAKPEELCLLGFPHLGLLSVRAFSCVLCGGLTAKNIVWGLVASFMCVLQRSGAPRWMGVVLIGTTPVGCSLLGDDARGPQAPQHRCLTFLHAAFARSATAGDAFAAPRLMQVVVRLPAAGAAVRRGGAAAG